MKKKILTICTLKNDLVEKYQDQLDYLPLSNDETDKTWEKLITHYQPQAIIFGLQTINEEKLSLWRKLQPTEKLKFIRKGTSMHRVDFAAAKKYSIDVLNTPGVNSPYVAEFILNLLQQKHKKDSLIGIIGVGDIGKKVVVKLLQAGDQVILYNRSHPHFEGNNYSYNDNLLNIFTEQHIQSIPQNGQLICISPPRVISAKAVMALHKREDIHVTFDHVSQGLTFIHESLGHTHLRQNFIFEEKAAASHDCQYAMGEAAIKIAKN
jgi:phosphoglycerate dehydrogenase-like enzyme